MRRLADWRSTTWLRISPWIAKIAAAAQAALRQDVREALEISEVVAGTQLEASAPVAMSEGALARALSAIDLLEDTAPTAGAAAANAADGLQELLSLPEPLRETALMAAGVKGWRYTGPGLRRLRLNVSDAVEAELYRIEPGAAVPRHTHEATEFTLVIQGGFSDETGSFGPGDMTVKGPEDTHTPVGDDDGVCIVLAVRDGGLRFKGLLGIVQRFLG
jgi:putative transcriptional regulator